MAYENGAIYWICPADNLNVALSVYGNSQVSQNRNVFLYTKENIADQLWKVAVSGVYSRIKTTLNESYALNIYLSTGNCDIYTWSNNLEDSKIKFHAVDEGQNIYRIQNYRNNANNNLYLTAGSASSGASVTWTSLNTSNSRQLWRLIKKPTGSSGNESNAISDITQYAISQKTATDVWLRQSGCAVTCGIIIASYYDHQQYGFNAFSNYWSSQGGYTWQTPNWNFADNDWAVNGMNEANTISYIKQYIDNGCPVACHAYGYGENQHWVVAYGYNNDTGWNGIMVIDPADGNVKNMADAMSYSTVNCGVDRLRARYTLN